MRVKNIGSNMTEVRTEDKIILISYETPVAVFVRGVRQGGQPDSYRTSKKWSATTTRHINKWLDGIKAEERPQEFFDNLLEEK
jgi:hypothetical protein